MDEVPFSLSKVPAVVEKLRNVYIFSAHYSRVEMGSGSVNWKKCRDPNPREPGCSMAELLQDMLARSVRARGDFIAGWTVDVSIRAPLPFTSGVPPTPRRRTEALPLAPARAPRPAPLCAYMRCTHAMRAHMRCIRAYMRGPSLPPRGPRTSEQYLEPLKSLHGGAHLFTRSPR